MLSNSRAGPFFSSTRRAMAPISRSQSTSAVIRRSSPSLSSTCIHCRRSMKLMCPPRRGAILALVDGGPDFSRHQVEDLEHLLEIVTSELEHHVREAQALELAELVDDGLRALREQRVAEAEAERQLDRLEAPAGGVGGGAESSERFLELRRSLGRRVPAVAECGHTAERAGAVAADPDRR